MVFFYILCIWFLCVLYKPHTVQRVSLIGSDIYNLECCTFYPHTIAKVTLSLCSTQALILFFFTLTSRFLNKNHDALLHVLTHFNTTDFQTHHDHHLGIMTMTPI